jgi:hypothetical protein
MGTLKIPLRKWEIFSSKNMQQTFNEAKRLGWLENKVQVRKYFDEEGTHYIIEPYEEGCSCSGIISPPIKEDLTLT